MASPSEAQMLLARSGFQERNTGRRGGVRAQLEGLIGREHAGSTRLPFCNQLRPLRGVERLNGVANDADMPSAREQAFYRAPHAVLRDHTKNQEFHVPLERRRAARTQSAEQRICVWI